VGQDCWFNVNDWSATDPGIRVAEGCFLARRNFFTCGKSIEIGSYCLTGPDCHFLGADHDWSDPRIPYALARVTCDDTIRIGSNCWLGARVTVLKGVLIGHGSVVGAGAVVTESLPPFSMAAGFPATLRKRYSFRKKRWILPQEFGREDEASLPPEDIYAREMYQRHGMPSLPRHAAGNFWGDL
jgi:acetyltransferase-like isoleucine patch superfamily enzyme